MKQLLFIGSLDVAPTFGGPIQFHRHFVERHDFELEKIIEPPGRRLANLRSGSVWVDRTVDRISRTRFFPHFVALNEWFGIRQAVPRLLRQTLEFKPDAIVTVAFGAYGFAAADVAERLNVPLITFFHDWWPDLALESKPGIRAFDWRMRWLYRRSNLALCVCDEMRRELGAHPNAKILFPISGSQDMAGQRIVRRTRPRIVYLGGMTRGYGRMLAALSRAYADSKTADLWELAIFGDVRDWPVDEVRSASQSGVYRGLKYGEETRKELEEADVFLVAMDFEKGSERRVRTSFPSKLLEYCAHGKPVVAWAPEYSSIAGFARDMKFPFLFCGRQARGFLENVSTFISDPVQMAQGAARARALRETIFSPGQIHSDLVSSINRVIDDHGQRVAGGTRMSPAFTEAS